MIPLRSPADFVEIEVAPGWMLCAERALFWREHRLLVVADIHWGYADSHRRIGNLLPPFGDAEIARRLDALLDFYQPATMIWLGDSIHTATDPAAAERYLDALPAGLEVFLLAGNHDRTWSRGLIPSLQIGSWVFHHGDRPRALAPGEREIIGHYHPALTLGDGAGLRLKAHVLVQTEKRWVLPSFSEWAAGAPYSGPMLAGDRQWIISARKIWSVEANRAP